MLTYAFCDCRSGNDDKPGVPQGLASFYCPVSMELMSDPVMVATGHSYDRTCIQKWLEQGNRTCPVTGLRLRHLELTPNIALRNAIQVSSSSIDPAAVWLHVVLLAADMSFLSVFAVGCCSAGVGFAKRSTAEPARCSAADCVQAG
jgi:F-box/WD-40 domain protein 7